MTRVVPDADVCVLLTPRAIGGHEVALLGWLGDAIALNGGALRPVIVAPNEELRTAAAKLGAPLWSPWPTGQDSPLALSAASTTTQRWRLLHVLQRWPKGRPLLLAPGVLHADAWLLAAALGMGHRVWVYVPMTHTAAHMGFRYAGLRDLSLAPWLGKVAAWITLDAHQAGQLRQAWRVTAPVHILPNRARLDGPNPNWPQPTDDGRLRVVFVGRFDAWQKGLDWLIGLLQQDPWWTRHCSWLFQGRGPAGGALAALATQMGVGQVSVHAQAPIDRALVSSDVLLLTSRFEGVPLVALEATARGWPVVATHGCGMDSWLPASSLFQFGDATGLRHVLEGLSALGARRHAVAAARTSLARQSTQAHYESSLHDLCAALRAASASAI